MKKFNLSLVALMAIGTFAVAGGDIAPVEPVVETPMVEESTGAFYVGLGYGMANVENSYNWDNAVIGHTDTDYDTVMLQAGYKFNPYIAVEGRYWFGSDETLSDTDRTGGWVDGDTINVDTWAIYVKPMYPVTEALDIYGLLGYADSSYDTTTVPKASIDGSGFSWGIGAAYAFTDNLAVFVDYTDMYDDEDNSLYLNGDLMLDTQVTSWNFGVTYTF